MYAQAVVNHKRSAVVNLVTCIAEVAANGKKDDMLIACNGLMVDEAEIDDEPGQVRRETLEQRRWWWRRC